MNEEQFISLLGKLEEIRYAIDNPQTKTHTDKKISVDLFLVKFYDRLQEKTGWGRNELKDMVASIITDIQE